MTKQYTLPLSGKTATRQDWSFGGTEITISHDSGTPFICRRGPSLAWQVWKDGFLLGQSLTLKTALHILDKAAA